MPSDYPHPDPTTPGQRSPIAGRAIFTSAYALIPAEVQTDIVASLLPGWRGARAWILARPLSGFAETFAQYRLEVEPGGGCENAEPDPEAQAALFVLGGEVDLTGPAGARRLGSGGFAYLPPGAPWSLAAAGGRAAHLYWIRKRWTPAAGLTPPGAYFADEQAIEPAAMPGAEGRWTTLRFMDPADLRHDMHVAIVSLAPGACIPFAETHVMEHGLAVLEGAGVYLLNHDWREVHAGDFMWLRAFCPQACHAVGERPFRYLLYKDVNRHPSLRPPI